MGVPVNAPAELRVKPGGSVPPETKVQAMGAVPLAVKAKVYGAPCVPAGGVALVMEGGVGAMTVKFTTWSIVPLPLDARTVNVVLAPVGVPDSTPVVEFRLRPTGAVPVGNVSQVMGAAPVAVKECV